MIRTASQRGTPFGDAIFLLVKKDSRERHAKEPMVLWKLLHYAAIAFALTNRCQTNSHRCLARILTSGGVPEYPKGISSGGTLCRRQGTSSYSVSVGCVLFHWFSAASCLLRPEVVRSNAVGSPLGGLLLSPANQVAQPSAALLRYGCGIPLAGTDGWASAGTPFWN